MNYHIVRMNETIDKIALTYNLTVDEIKDINKQIRNWDNLTPGLKLNLPAIPEVVKDDLNDIEPFIEDYYPRYDGNIDDSLYEEKEEYKKTEKPVESVASYSTNTTQVEKVSIPKHLKMPIYYNGYYPPYLVYNPYYSYYNNMRKRKNNRS